ncbi:MAG: riboflavin kinase [Patescibacteria group bacterium]|jgi:riboflavin kinase/FMN adenylyltransferase
MKQISGKIIRGENIGERLGYPTANFSKRSLGRNKIAKGVYAAKAVLGHKEYIALLVMGVPGFKRFKKGKIETYLIGRRDSNYLYGRTLVVKIFKKIRPLKKYTEEKLLIARIKKDIKTARRYFK